MIKLKNILFPTDFSRCADQALIHAVYLAEKYGTTLHLLHVVTLFKDQPDVLSDELVETEELVRKLEEKAEIELNTVANTHGNDDMEIVVKQKRAISAAPAILEYSSKNGIDLIVMGTHGRRGIEHLLLGSAAEEVIRLAECPVFTIRESEEIKPIKLFERILVPIDFSDHSKKALVYAKEIADSYDANLQLLHVIEDTVHPAYSLSGKSSIFDLVPGIEEDCRRRIEKMVLDVGITNEKTEIIIQGGQASHDIIKFAKDNSSDLVVIATHGLTGIEHLLLGSVTEKVVRMAPCPVFTVKSFGKNLT
jgi:nucleotide-binding universal stress UspA family protein